MFGPTRLNSGEFRSISCRRSIIFSHHVRALELCNNTLYILFNLRFLALSWYFGAKCLTLSLWMVGMCQNAPLLAFGGKKMVESLPE